MVRPASGRIIWTQAVLDALAIRFGSNDATPDIGPHAVLGEAVVRKGVTEAMFGTTGDVTVTASRDPDSGGILSLTTTTPVGKSTELHYEINASPTDVTLAENSTRDDALNAPDRPTVNYAAIYPAAEGVPDA
jgi:hypothetical protein